MQVPAIPLSEPIIVPDVFVTGLADVEHLGDGVFRFTFFTQQKLGDEHEHIVVARLILASAAIYLAAKWALKAIGLRCCGCFVRDGWTH
jgi:hypothetical protein